MPRRCPGVFGSSAGCGGRMRWQRFSQQSSGQSEVPTASYTPYARRPPRSGCQARALPGVAEHLCRFLWTCTIVSTSVDFMLCALIGAVRSRHRWTRWSDRTRPTHAVVPCTRLTHDTGVSQVAVRGFWCCDRSDCSYREFPRERKQTPQVALEISSPTTFMVSVKATNFMAIGTQSRATWPRCLRVAQGHLR